MPSTSKNHQQNLPKVAVLKRSRKGAMTAPFVEHLLHNLLPEKIQQICNV